MEKMEFSLINLLCELFGLNHFKRIFFRMKSEYRMLIDCPLSQINFLLHFSRSSTSFTYSCVHFVWIRKSFDLIIYSIDRFCANAFRSCFHYILSMILNIYRENLFISLWKSGNNLNYLNPIFFSPFRILFYA